MHLFLPVDVRKRCAERLHFVVDVVFLTQRAHERCHLVQVVSGHSREETANTGNDCDQSSWVATAIRS